MPANPAIGDERELLKTLLTVLETGPIPVERWYLPGMNHPTLDSAGEWLQFNILNSEGLPSRVIDYKASFTFELILYVVHVGLHGLSNLYRQRELAQIYKDLFPRRLNSAGTCLVVKEPRIMYLDLDSLGDFASNIRQRSPAANVNSVDMLWPVDIFESRLP